MDIQEFVFRHMHGTTTGRCTSDKSNGEEVDRKIRQADIKNDPECREMCARFLYTEIAHEGMGTNESYDVGGFKDAYEPLAEYFINNIVPSNDFMHDCIDFFARIRDGRLPA